MSTTMNFASINPDLTVTFEQRPIPTPTEHQIIIKASTAAINPTDWKSASRYSSDDRQPRGKDFSGVVHAVGSKAASQFKVGDRVGGFNISSGYAEYSVSPAWTTSHLPDHVSFEESVSIALPYYTAALALFKDLPLPAAPWNPARSSERTPLLIYGASSAVGAYAVKLAALSNIHPIIAVAGGGKSEIVPVLKPELGDTLIDYREHKSADSLVEAISAALDGASGTSTFKFVFDVVGTEYTINDVVAHVLDPQESYLVHAIPVAFKLNVPAVTRSSFVFAPGLFQASDPEGENGRNGKTNVGSRAFASVATRYLEFALAEGLMKAHQYEVLQGGLGGLQQGLVGLKEGKNRSLRYVMRIGETQW